MPTILRIGAYRFFFYASDRREPAHVHVERQGRVAKFWLEPVRLQRSGGFSRVEIRFVQNQVDRHRVILMRGWNEYFGG